MECTSNHELVANIKYAARILQFSTCQIVKFLVPFYEAHTS